MRVAIVVPRASRHARREVVVHGTHEVKPQKLSDGAHRNHDGGAPSEFEDQRSVGACDYEARAPRPPDWNELVLRQTPLAPVEGVRAVLVEAVKLVEARAVHGSSARTRMDGPAALARVPLQTVAAHLLLERGGGGGGEGSPHRFPLVKRLCPHCDASRSRCTGRSNSSSIPGTGDAAADAVADDVDAHARNKF